MSQGNVSSWQVKEGDEIAAGDALAEIETDMATLVLENKNAGFVAKILVQAGSKGIAVGTPLAVIVDEEGKIGDFKDYSPDSAEKPSTAESSSKANSPGSFAATEAVPPQRRRGGLLRIGPAARRLLSESGILKDDIPATGPLGVLTKDDVLAALQSDQKPKQQPQEAKAPQSEQKARKPSSEGAAESSQEAPAEEQRYRDVPNSQIRKIIAHRLLESKLSVPHVYNWASADLEAVTQLRQAMKEQGTKVSVNDFVVRAVACALAEVPQANSMWDAEAEEVVSVKSIDVAIAVATDKGLITPIVKAANTKSLKQVSEEVRSLAAKARANKLKPDEFQGGTFTISNLGMFGMDQFSAIINPPQAGILAVGGTQQNIIMENGHPVARASMQLTLSADQRVFDGETTYKFLEAVCDNLAHPVKLLV